MVNNILIVESFNDKYFVESLISFLNDIDLEIDILSTVENLTFLPQSHRVHKGLKRNNL